MDTEHHCGCLAVVLSGLMMPESLSKLGNSTVFQFHRESAGVLVWPTLNTDEGRAGR